MKRLRLFMLSFAAVLSASVILNCGCAFAHAPYVQEKPAAGHCEHQKDGHEAAADHEACCGRCHAEAFAVTPSQIFLEKQGLLSFLESVSHLETNLLLFAFDFSNTGRIQHAQQSPPGMGVSALNQPLYLTLQAFLI